MTIKKYIYGPLALCLGVMLLEAAYFWVILGCADRIADADAIVVFRGAGGRMEAGVELQRLGYAPQLVLSPAGRQQLGGLPIQVAESLIIEDRARTTFENALYTRDIVIEHGIRSVILVTSDYHAPRSYFLLKSLLLDQDVQINLYKVPTGGEAGTFPPGSIRSLKILYNEMVKLRVSKNAILGPNSLPGFWTQRISLMIPICVGFGTNHRGPKSGQGKLADLDALGQALGKPGRMGGLHHSGTGSGNGSKEY